MAKRICELPLVLPGQLPLFDAAPRVVTHPDVLVADPPWSFGDALPGKSRGAAKNYACMDVDALCAFTLPPLSSNAVLFLWRVASMQEEALRVARAWGFAPKSELVWLKQTATGKRHFGMGRYVRMSHEVCLICTRGKAMPESHSIRSVFEAPVAAHSQKPDAFYDLVREMYPNSRKVEMFARVVRADFEQHGDQLGKLASVAEEAV